MHQSSRNNSAAAERGIDPRAHLNHHLSHSGDVGDKRYQNRNEYGKQVPGNALNRLTDSKDKREIIDSIVPMASFEHAGCHRGYTFSKKPLLETGKFHTT
jgi:hypothetical protein